MLWTMTLPTLATKMITQLSGICGNGVLLEAEWVLGGINGSEAVARLPEDAGEDTGVVHISAEHRIR
jgi:hypothetical protein